MVSDVAVRPLPAQAVAAPLFAGWVRGAAAVILVLGPLLQVVEFLLAAASDDNAERVAFWSAHPAQTELSMAAGLLAVPFLLAGAYVIVALARARSPRLTLTAGALMTLAMVGLGAL